MIYCINILKLLTPKKYAFFSSKTASFFSFSGIDGKQTFATHFPKRQRRSQECCLFLLVCSPEAASAVPCVPMTEDEVKKCPGGLVGLLRVRTVFSGLPILMISKSSGLTRGLPTGVASAGSDGGFPRLPPGSMPSKKKKQTNKREMRFSAATSAWIFFFFFYQNRFSQIEII